MTQRKMTASAIISFVERLETESSAFYDKIADMASEDKEVFKDFAREGRKNQNLMVRTYRETISDALEACFSFEDLDLSAYVVETTIAQKTTYAQALELALHLEKNASKFYGDLAECSASLLATIPRAFKRVAETRKKRIPVVQRILNQL
jgi:hypothetical protein